MNINDFDLTTHGLIRRSHTSFNTNRDLFTNREILTELMNNIIDQGVIHDDSELESVLLSESDSSGLAKLNRKFRPRGIESIERRESFATGTTFMIARYHYCSKLADEEYYGHTCDRCGSVVLSHDGLCSKCNNIVNYQVSSDRFINKLRQSL